MIEMVLVVDRWLRTEGEMEEQSDMVIMGSVVDIGRNVIIIGIVS